MKIAKLILMLIVFSLIVNQQIYSQAQRVTARGNYTYRKAGVMRGNQVRTVFSNYGVIGNPGNQGPQVAWKYDANGYADDISALVGVKLPLQKDPNNKNYLDTVVEVIIPPVDRPGGGNTNSINGQFGGFEPIPGFANPVLNKIGEGIAISNIPETWPMQWPDHPDWTYSGKPVLVNGKDVTPKVDWDGYFGRGQFNADQEGYYWMDDNEDAKMYKIYGFLPDSTDLTRHGQGIQASVRSLQWSNFLAQNVIFWLYDFTNDGTTLYPQAVFGTLVGTYVGGRGDEANDDASFFDVRNSITYSWDIEPGMGIEYVRPEANPYWQPNPFAVGYIAYAFLESPGDDIDGIDNDGDNAKYDNTAPYFTENDFKPHIVQAGDELILIDKNTYKRTPFIMPNDTVTVYSMGVPFFLKPGVTSLVEGNVDPQGNLNPNAYDGIDNNLNGIIDENYLVDYRQFKKSPKGVVLIDTVNPVQYKNYITGQGVNAPMIDEARDDGIDNNKNWNLNDDVGLDGKAGTHDYGEGDGIPTSGYQKPGVGGAAMGPVNIYGLVDTHEPGEPDIDKTDVQESDQIGLTSFQYFTPAGAITMSDQLDMWRRMTPGLYDVPASVVNNTATHGEDGDFIMGSGYFPLRPGETERFSLALGFGDDLTQTIKTKKVAQLIYDGNYNFPMPPAKPTLTVVPGDGKVTLYWDRVAETTIDKATHKIEFEGYKIYRGTDPDFTDALNITDMNGAKVFYKPIYQCDLVDGITGLFTSSQYLYNLTNGAPYYLGNDSGIQNFYVDQNLTNGRTYYYAVVGYTKGISSLDIFPSENTHYISKDVTGAITTDINTAAVVPNPPTLGYVPPPSGVPLSRISGISNAVPYFEVINPYTVQDSTFNLTFEDSLVNGVHIAYAYSVTNAGNGSTLLNKIKLLPENGVVFDGIRLSIDTSYQSPAAIVFDTATSGWNHPAVNNLSAGPSQVFYPTINVTGIRFPRTYKFVFDNTYSDTSNTLSDIFGVAHALPKKVINFKVYDVTSPNYPVQVKYGFVEANQFRVDTLSNLDQVFLSDSAGKELSWRVLFTGNVASNIPQAGDTLTIDFTKPLTSKDEFSFTTQGPTTDVSSIQAQLDKIRAVPNPYVVTDVFEQSLPSTIRGRGERVIDFINLPPKCTIKIFTSAGDLVRTLEQNGGLNNSTVTWDLRSKEGLDIAYGVYFYVVQVPNSSAKKIGKLAIIK